MLMMKMTIFRLYFILRKWTEIFTRRQKQIHEGRGTNSEVNSRKFHQLIDKNQAFHFLVRLILCLFYRLQ